MKSRPTLESFLEDPRLMSQWVWFKTIECYVRRGRRMVDDQILSAITVASFSNKADKGRRAKNTEFDPNHTRTGLLKEFDDHLKKLCLQYVYDGIYYECVVNEFLPDVLVRYGYRRVNKHGPVGLEEHNYWWPVDE